MRSLCSRRWENSRHIICLGFFLFFFLCVVDSFLNWPPTFLSLTNPVVRSWDPKRRWQQPSLACKQEMLIARPIRRFSHGRQSRRPAPCATRVAVQPVAAAFATHFMSPLPEHVRDYNVLCLAVFSLSSTTSDCWWQDWMYYFLHKGSLKQSDWSGRVGQMARLVCLGD